MKRLALLLGSLLVVSAAASAKEVVPAPVVVEETPVQIIEKEVIVYRDREPEWRPTGSFHINETFFGKTEGDSYKAKKGWKAENQFLRTQAEASVALTEKASVDLRARTYQGVHSADDASNSIGDQLRARFFYDHGTLGDSKVNVTSRVKYEKVGEKRRGNQTVEYGLNFDFADYMFSNDFVKTTSFVVGPVVSRNWGDKMWTHDGKTGDEFRKLTDAGEHGKLVEDEEGNMVKETTSDAKFGYVDTVGLYFDWTTELPYGFGTEVEIDTLGYSVGNKKGVFVDNRHENLENKAKKSKFAIPVKAVITNFSTLYSNDEIALTTWFEGGFDTYNYSNRDKDSYSAYMIPELQLTYHVNKFVDVYGLVGGEYRNWTNTAKTSAQDWRWQPYGRLGLKATF